MLILRIKGMKDKKKYVDYIGLVGLLGLSSDLNLYCRKHRGLSPRRNARNFLLKRGYYNVLKVCREDGFDWSKSFEQMVKIAKTPWLEKR